MRRRAYDLAIAGLDQSSEPYAIVVFNRNELKAINDRYGHEKGDIAIQKLSGLICDVFRHSPVFRIDGDEFAAILTKRDYESRESLIEQFREEVRKADESSDPEPWEKPSAACGYAVYDAQTDSGAASVFERADKNMYENKKSDGGQMTLSHANQAFAEAGQAK